MGEQEEAEEAASDTTPPVLDKDRKEDSEEEKAEDSEEEKTEEPKKCAEKESGKCIHININNVNNLGHNNGTVTQQQGNPDEEGPKRTMTVGGSALKWNYGRNGDDWEGLCKTGRKQSPIDIETKEAERVGGKNKRLQFAYRALQNAVVQNDNSRALMVDSQRKMGYLKDGQGTRYDLVQLNVHTRSEHQIDGRQFDVEVHLLHQKKGAVGTDDLLAIAVLFKVDMKAGDNDFFAQLIGKGLPEANKKVTGPEIDLVSLDEALRGPNFAYEGSLTVPSCEESVEWHVVEDVQKLSADQYDALREVVKNNQREVQPLNGRTVYRIA